MTGLCLTLADSGNNKVAVVGPTSIQRFMNCTKFFMRLTEGLIYFVETPVSSLSRASHDSFQCKDITIEAISMRSSCTMSANSSLDAVSRSGWQVPATATQQKLDKCNRDQTLCPTDSDTKASPDYEVDTDIHAAFDTNSHICYICRTPPTAGKFDIKRAQQLGVPRGPLYGRLKAGHAVTLPDGTAVQPADVLGEVVPSKVFFVVPCIEPEESEVLETLVNSPHLLRYHDWL